MNFFGHAIVASWTSVEPAFVLGSMVPDFANMVGARVPRVFHEGVARGVEFHHATDRVFHIFLGEPSIEQKQKVYIRIRKQLRSAIAANRN